MLSHPCLLTEGIEAMAVFACDKKRACHKEYSLPKLNYYSKNASTDAAWSSNTE